MVVVDFDYTDPRSIRATVYVAASVHHNQSRIRSGEKPRTWHPSYTGRADAPPVKLPRRYVRAIDSFAVEELTEARRSWALGVEPVTVEDLAAVDAVATVTVTTDRAREEAVPHRPRDLEHGPPRQLPRGDSPSPAPFPARVFSHHFARTYGGAPPT